MNIPSLKPLSQPLNIPKSFPCAVSVVSDCHLTETELELLSHAFHAVSMVAQAVKPSVPQTRMNIILLDADHIDIVFPGNDTFGAFFSAIFYPVGMWRRMALSKETVLFAMIEELCHAIWQVPDGPQVQALVTRALKLFAPGATYAAFFVRALSEKNQYLARNSGSASDK